MSRIGQAPIPIPAGVQVKLDPNNVVSVKGQQGPELTKQIHPAMKVEVEDDEVRVVRPTDQKQHKALHGLSRSLIANMVTGVTEGFAKQLEVFGLGYRANLDGPTLVLELGYSHPCRLRIPEGLEVQVEGNRVTVRGADKERVGQFAASIKKLRKMSVYRPRGTELRGIRYVGEQIRFKAGKAGKVGGG